MVKRYYNAFAYCNEKMFPQPRFGITASVGAARPTVFDERSGELVHFDDGTLDRILTYGRTEYQFNVAFSAGIFFRFPIEEVMSFQPEIQYYYQSNKGVLGNPWLHPAARTKIGFETHSVRAPLLFRFTNNYAKKRLMPYAELGPVFYANFGSYWIDKYKDKQRGLPIFTVGVAIGVGMEYYINASQAFSIGARFNWMSNVGGRERIYNNLNFELVAGFSLFKM